MKSNLIIKWREEKNDDDERGKRGRLIYVKFVFTLIFLYSKKTSSESDVNKVTSLL